jgi:hypothetical protein
LPFNHMRKKPIIFSLLIVLAFSPITAFALNMPGQPGVGAAINPWAIFENILNFIWPIFVGVAILMFIYAGFMFLTANGEPGKVATARHALVWGIVGVLVALLAFSLVTILASLVTRIANLP